MPRLHPREKMVTKASTDLRIQTIDWMLANSELTNAEMIQTLTAVFAESISGLTKYAIRSERHPDDPDKPGGWE